MSGTQPLPDTCFYTDLKFDVEIVETGGAGASHGTVSFPALIGPAGADAQRHRRMSRNAKGCQTATQDDCASDGAPEDPLRWFAGFDRDYNHVRLAVDKCQMRRSVLPDFEQSADGRILMLLGFGIDATGDSQLVEYEWRPTP